MGFERGIVLLVDSARRPSFLQKEIIDLRQIAVNSSSRNLLSDIGAWDQVSTRAWPVHKMSIGTILHIRESCLKILRCGFFKVDPSSPPRLQFRFG